jgi:hypothetical protein
VVGILIPLTIGWKILGPSHVEREMNGTLISFLTRNNFEIIAHDDLVDDDSWTTEVPLIQARRRQCDLWIARLNLSPLIFLAFRFNSSYTRVQSIKNNLCTGRAQRLYYREFLNKLDL